MGGGERRQGMRGKMFSKTFLHTIVDRSFLKQFKTFAVRVLSDHLYINIISLQISLVAEQKTYMMLNINLDYDG
jgi:hypothetical protein